MLQFCDYRTTGKHFYILIKANFLQNIGCVNCEPCTKEQHGSDILLNVLNMITHTSSLIISLTSHTHTHTHTHTLPFSLQGTQPWFTEYINLMGIWSGLLSQPLCTDTINNPHNSHPANTVKLHVLQVNHSARSRKAVQILGTFYSSLAPLLKQVNCCTEA